MKKFIAIASAVAMTAGLSVAAASPAEAWYPHHNYNPGVAFGAGVLGFMAGAAIAASQDRYYHNGYYGGPGWDDHVAACAHTYRSYSTSDDAYTTRDTSGRLVRVPCQL